MTPMSRTDLAALRATWGPEVVVGFTSGTFDILHAGHVALLQEARSRCDILLVGINSDSSVRSYKSPNRPIQSEANRLKVVAALGCVDYAFIFNEPRNTANIETLKPSIYFKGGDYEVAQLSSAPLVAEYGGRVELISYVQGESTTNILQRIQDLARISPATAASPGVKRPIAFLDRDGTLIELVDYLSDPSKVCLLSSVVEGLKLLQQEGYALVITTNQPGIGLGYHSEADFYQVMLRLFELVSDHGILFDKVYFCPEGKAGASSFRKPGRGMFDRAVKELSAEVERSFVIGDSEIDMEFAWNCGLPGVLVRTGKSKEGVEDTRAQAVCENFLDAVRSSISLVSKAEAS